ncbi:MAG TPA: ATP-binding cassette domain-containing protein, partial [Methylovirgula sp.]
MSLLEIRNLSIGFQQDGRLTKAVDDISLDIERGRTLALVGESGSGKSLTALSILKLLPPGASAKGRVLFKGKDLMTCRPSELRAIRGDAITMVFQEPMTSLNPLHTI